MTGIVKKNPGIGHVEVPALIKGTGTNAGLHMEADPRCKSYADAWIADLRKPTPSTRFCRATWTS
ncbi:MAG: hypothetical protein GW907_09850 [Betaproteobacteria bacterium]|nr:hypothetical protein [Betaproteobacteria bacterium]NCP82012.1 hypothetical protein [Rhodoferax sp.]OIP20895.1 MAG: hypothetical protein AUK50_02560 [Comamonadaceae bacterium CG2_30_57_122]PIZ23792.1 MAG: hypothetical protein COY49_01425 [Comamonadaceae bacterium CG_4_10_14_0_8_um_filter_57_29]PJC12811.1 MAG: hypothetical protein CO065_17655 [Comamonadaceae bacterium CG_4_9_14_0_8_um_filter_57_21]